MVKAAGRTPANIEVTLAAIQALLTLTNTYVDGLEALSTLINGNIVDIETLLGIRLPATLDAGALRVREQNPLVTIIAEGAAGDPLFNVEAQWSERQINAAAPAGLVTLDSTPTPANKVRVATTIAATNTTSVANWVYIGKTDQVNDYRIDLILTPAIIDGVHWSGWLVLAEGWRVRGLYDGTILNDTVILDINGFIMDA